MHDHELCMLHATVKAEKSSPSQTKKEAPAATTSTKRRNSASQPRPSGSRQQPGRRMRRARPSVEYLQHDAEDRPPHAYATNASIFETEHFQEGGHKPHTTFGTFTREAYIDSETWCSHLPGALPQITHRERARMENCTPAHCYVGPSKFDVGRNGGATRWDRVGQPRSRRSKAGPREPVPGSTLEKKRNRVIARERELQQISTRGAEDRRAILQGSSLALPPPSFLFLPLRDPLRVILPRLP